MAIMGIVFRLIPASLFVHVLSVTNIIGQVGQVASQQTYCDETILKTFKQCSSCKDRCSKTTTVRDMKLCSCDMYCKVYGDCCADFQSYCPNDHQEALTIRKTLKTVQQPDVMCLRINRRKFSLFVSSCTKPTYPNPCVQNNSELNRFLPVMDSLTGIHYSNFECAKCNGVESGQVWNISFDCKNNILSYLRSGNKNGKSSKGAKLSKAEVLVLLRLCQAQMTPPKGVPLLRDCRPIRSGCDSNCKNNTIEEKCKQYQNYVAVKKWNGPSSDAPRKRFFKNEYCALCSGIAPNELTCSLFPESYIPEDTNTISFSVLVDFNPSNGIHVGGRNPVKCKAGTVVIDDACVPLLCRPGFVRAGNTCLASVDYLVNTTFSVRVNEPVNNLVAMQQIISSAVNDTTIRSLRQKIGGAMFRKLAVNIDLLSKINPVEFRIFVTYRHVANMLMAFVKEVNEDVKQAVSMLLKVNITMTLVNVSVEVLTNTTDCVRVRYERSKIKILSDENLEVIASGKRYPLKESVVRRRFVFVCVDVDNLNNTMKRKAFNFSSTMGVVTIVCTSLSLVALSIRLGLQCVVPAFKSFSGKLQFFLCLTLFVASAAFLVGPVLAEFRVPCFIAAVLVHWAFLSAFLWMSTIAFHTWWLFRPPQSFRKYDEVSRSMLRHGIVPLGIPTLLVATCIGLDLSSQLSWVKPHYGDSICWITNKYALICFFIVPVGLCVIFNIVLFIVTSTIISKALATAAEVTGREHKQNFLVYLRLFIVMGTTWIFGFIAAGTRLEALWYIFIILNASQGIFIFIGFVCTKRVWRTFDPSDQTDGTTLSSKRSGSIISMKNQEKNIATTTALLTKDPKSAETQSSDF